MISAPADPAPLSPELQLRWANDTSHTIIRDGVLFRNDCHVKFLSGAQIIAWTSLLATHLDGEQPIAVICNQAPPEEREQLLSFMNVLKSERFLEVSEVPEKSVFTRIFRPQLDLLFHLTDAPLDRFSDFRNSQVLLTGSGVPLEACACALLRSGLKALHIASGVEQESLKKVQATVRELETKGVEAGITTADLKTSPETLSGFDLVAYCSDGVRLSETVRLNRTCDRSRTPFLAGFSIAGWSLLGPIVRQSNKGCWVCGLRRMAPHLADLPSTGFLDQNKGAQLEELPVDHGAATELGTDMAFAIFKFLAGNVRPQLEDSMLIQKRDTERGFDARMVPQPLCACMGYCERYITS